MSLVDDLQAWKTTKYQELIGMLHTFPGSLPSSVDPLWQKPKPSPHRWALVLVPVRTSLSLHGLHETPMRQLPPQTRCTAADLTWVPRSQRECASTAACQPHP